MNLYKVSASVLTIHRSQGRLAHSPHSPLRAIRALHTVLSEFHTGLSLMVHFTMNYSRYNERFSTINTPLQ